MKMRLINADALHATLKAKQKWVVKCGDKHNEGYTSDQVHFAIDDAPTIEERKTGKWVYDENGMDWNIPAWKCRECGMRNAMIPTIIQYRDGPYHVTNPYIWAGSKFCPNCGAKMEGAE